MPASSEVTPLALNLPLSTVGADFGGVTGAAVPLAFGGVVGAAELVLPGAVLGGAAADAVDPLVGGGAVLVVPVVPDVAPAACALLSFWRSFLLGFRSIFDSERKVALRSAGVK